MKDEVSALRKVIETNEELMKAKDDLIKVLQA